MVNFGFVVIITLKLTSKVTRKFISSVRTRYALWKHVACLQTPWVKVFHVSLLAKSGHLYVLS